MSKVSVIIPVYNMENYLDDCLNSIINQTETEIEIIVINDGSTDQSIKVINSYALHDPRIRVFDISNHGVAYCRNLGLKESRSEWIMFVDSDDWLPEKSVETLYSHVNKEADIICGDYTDRKEYKLEIISNEGRQVSEVSDKEVLRSCCLVNPKTHSRIYKSIADTGLPSLTFVWGKLYRRDLLVEHAVLFDGTMRRGEDHLFNLECTEFADKVIFDSSITYFYRTRYASASRSWANAIDEYCHYALKVDEKVREKIETDPFLNAAWKLKRFEVIMKTFSFASMEKTDQQQVISDLNRLIENQYYKEAIDSDNELLDFSQIIIQLLLRNNYLKSALALFRAKNALLRLT